MNNIFGVPLFLVFLIGLSVFILALLALVSVAKEILEGLEDDDDISY